MDASIDKLAFVREKLVGLDSRQVLRLAADAEVSIRTVYNVADPERDPHYSSVAKLYDVLSVKTAAVYGAANKSLAAKREAAAAAEKAEAAKAAKKTPVRRKK